MISGSRAPLRRLGLFGGSFDPVHAGHLHAARTAQAAFELDRMVFVPAARPPHKPGRVLAEGRDRAAMLELAIRGEPSWTVSRLELEREGRSYTMDTVRELARRVGEPEESAIYMVIGSDNLPGLPDWSRVEELLERVHPVVVFREGTPRASLAALGERLPPHLVAKLEAGFLEVPPVTVSSTELREWCRTAAEAPLQVAPEVWEYIRARGLYTHA